MKLYAIYNKNEEIVCVGSSKECSNFLEVTIDSFYTYVSKILAKRITNRKYMIYVMEDKEVYNE